ncbi:MAG: LEA type 2 family protein [Proteobacteria bacterium]|nr:LEA type 2 family protein [Pseudomonadota bacterium]
MRSPAAAMERAGGGVRRAVCRIAACVLLVMGLHLPVAQAQSAPGVSIASVDGIALQGRTAVLDLTLAVRNTGSLALPLQAVRFHLAFTDIDVADGQSTEPVTIPAGGEAKLPVRLTVDSTRLLAVFATLPPDGQVSYTLQGHAEIGLTMLQVPFSHEGTVTLSLR